MDGILMVSDGFTSSKLISELPYARQIRNVLSVEPLNITVLSEVPVGKNFTTFTTSVWPLSSALTPRKSSFFIK